MAQHEPPTVLIVEDDAGIAALQRRRLERAGYRVVVASTTAEASACLAREDVQLLVLDYMLPDENGLAWYAELKRAGREVPAILVTALSHESAILEALRAGVRDFVTKSLEYLEYLPEAVERVLRQVSTETQLAESQARLAGIVNSARDAILTVEADGRISFFNPAAEAMFRCPAATAVGQPIHRFLPPPAEPGADRAALDFGAVGVRGDGERFPAEATAAPGEVLGRKFYTVVVRDVTQARRVEEELRGSQRFIQSITDAMPYLLYLYDLAEGRCVYANRQTTAVLGYTPEEIYRGDVTLVGHLLVDGAARRLAEVGPGDILETEVRVRHADGAQRWLRHRDTVFNRNPDGTPRVILGVARDVTEEKWAAEQIREQAALLDKARDAILVRGMDDHIAFWNQSAERLYGWTAAEALGRNANELLFPGVTPELELAQRLVLEQGEWLGEQRQVTRAGAEVLVESRWTLVRDAEGRPRSVLVINTDVTEKKKLQAQFLRAQRLESIGTLAGGIAHDLNNVLTPITMAIELLKTPLPDAQRRNFLAILQHSAERGTEMVRQVLSFARGAEGQRSYLQLRHLLADVEKMLRQTLPKSITIETQVARDLWAVQGDATQLYQVLVNLCVNARDAMAAGGRLTVTAENRVLDAAYAQARADARPGPHVVIGVADTGAGIPPPILDKIFDPFFTTKEAGQGTGLGLSTALGIVRAHGGFLSVYSEVGCGTRFAVHLPAAQSVEIRQALEQQPRLPVGANELILVVDDEASVREIARATLEAHGYRVLVAADGAEALSLFAARHEEIQAVITDMMMPVMDGATVVRGLRKVKPAVRVVAASGLANAEAADCEVQAFLPKPFTAEMLLVTLHRVLHGA